MKGNFERQFVCQIFLEVGEEPLGCLRAFQADFEEKEPAYSGVRQHGLDYLQKS